MNAIPLDARFFKGAVSFEKDDGWIRPWRLPFRKLRLFPPDGSITDRAGLAAGVRLRFATEATRASLAVRPHEEPRLFDVVIDGEIVRTAALDAGGEEVAFGPLPAGTKTVEIWLPQAKPAALRGLLLDAPAEPADDPRPKWIAYGSSITQCASAHSPARTWPSIAARARGLDLTCLGYGGNCHLDPLVALMIRDLPADVITLKLGINMHGGSVSPRTFRPLVIGFVALIREKHAEVPIALVSPITSPPREDTPGATGMTLKAMRAELADAARRLIDCGDPNLHVFEGPDLFGPDLAAKYLPDGLHPDGDGYEALGRNFAEQVLPKLGF